MKDVDDKSLMEGKKAIINLEAYGCKDWYDWCIRNWGTKWDAGTEPIHLTKDEDKEKFIQDCVDSDEFLIHFETAWSPPMEWMQGATERFPLLCFVNRVTEESNAFVGCPVAMYGEVCENITSVDYPRGS